MPIVVSIPTQPDLHLEHLLLDVNGTLTRGGRLIDGVQSRLTGLRGLVDVRLLSADTFGTLDDVAEQLGGLPVERVSDGEEKAALANRLGARRCAAVGNGANDEHMLRAVALGIAVLGPEGAAPRTLAAAEVLTASVLDALDLLLAPKTLTATLRA
jgi:soluble P-type ATPase